MVTMAQGTLTSFSGRAHRVQTEPFALFAIH